MDPDKSLLKGPRLRVVQLYFSLDIQGVLLAGVMMSRGQTVCAPARAWDP